nr:hypothetical protein [Tanacetum cinerariifolium]
MDQDSAHMVAASKVPMIKPDAKQLLEAVEKRFGRNAATKKTQKNLLKQQFETFSAPSLDMLDQTFDRLQKWVSRLELLGEKLSQEDVNQKLLRSFTNGVVSIAQVVNTANGVFTASTQINVALSTNINNLSDSVICAFLASQPNSPQLAHEDLEQIHPDDMKEMDLRWQMAMLTMGPKECYNCHKRGYFARECCAPRYQDNKYKETTKRSVPMKIPASTALVSCDGLGGYDWSDQAEEGPNYALMDYTSSTSDSKVLKVEIQMKEIAIKELRRKLEVARKEKDGIQLKKGLGYESYNAVPPSYIRNFMPPKPDLSFTCLDDFVNEPEVENSHTKSSEEETKFVKKNVDALTIKEWVSNDEDENVTQPKIEKKIVRRSIVKKEFVIPRQQEKSTRKTVKKVEHNRQNTHRPRGNQRTGII